LPSSPPSRRIRRLAGPGRSARRWEEARVFNSRSAVQAALGRGGGDVSPTTSSQPDVKKSSAKGGPLASRTRATSPAARAAWTTASRGSSAAPGASSTASDALRAAIAATREPCRWRSRRDTAAVARQQSMSPAVVALTSSTRRTSAQSCLLVSRGPWLTNSSAAPSSAMNSDEVFIGLLLDSAHLPRGQLAGGQITTG